MFGTNDVKAVEKAEAKRSYEIKVDAVRKTKKDNILMVDLDVNGVKIKSCMLKEITVKADGEKHKAGDICYVLNFPSEKSGDKYYNRVWFPYSNADVDNICKQVQALL